MHIVESSYFFYFIFFIGQTLFCLCFASLNIFKGLMIVLTVQISTLAISCSLSTIVWNLCARRTGLCHKLTTILVQCTSWEWANSLEIEINRGKWELTEEELTMCDVRSHVSSNMGHVASSKPKGMNGGFHKLKK